MYNLQYPRVPAQPQPPFWSVADLGLQAQTSPGDTGIRPDDALFLNANNTSRSRNLLLFRHRAEALTRRLIRVELDLPRPGASVTVQILTSATDQTVLRTQQLGVRPAGWTTGFVSLPFDIATGNAYRIRAEIGDPNDPVNYYEGQYVQTLTIPANVPPTPAETSPVYLPVMSAPPPPEGENVLRNGSFTAEVAGTTLPDFWEVQGMFSPGVNIDDKISVIDFPAAPQKGLQLVAAPQSRAEILQRFHVSSPGNYRLTYTLRVNNVPNNLNTQLFVRLRNLTGGDWRVLERHTNSANGTTTTYTEDITVNEPGLISFQASFGADAGTATFTLSNISIRRLSGTSTMQGESVVQTNVQTIPPQNDDPTPTPTENPYPGPATPTPTEDPYPGPTTPIPTNPPPPTPTPDPFPTPFATPTPSFEFPLQVSGTAATGAITVTAPGRFQLVFDEAHQLQASEWYDLASSEPTVNLAQSDGPSLNYNVLQSPLELFYDSQWQNLTNALTPTITIAEQNAELVTLRTAWSWSTSAGGHFRVFTTHRVWVTGLWEVHVFFNSFMASPMTCACLISRLASITTVCPSAIGRSPSARCLLSSV